MNCPKCGNRMERMDHADVYRCNTKCCPLSNWWSPKAFWDAMTHPQSQFDCECVHPYCPPIAGYNTIYDATVAKLNCPTCNGTGRKPEYEIIDCDLRTAVNAFLDGEDVKQDNSETWLNRKDKNLAVNTITESQKWQIRRKK